MIVIRAKRIVVRRKCRSCKDWGPCGGVIYRDGQMVGFGVCLTINFGNEHNMDSPVIIPGGNDPGRVRTRADFGCIHWKRRSYYKRVVRKKESEYRIINGCLKHFQDGKIKE